MTQSHPPDGPSKAHVIAAFAAVYLIWGSTYLAIRYAIETLPPFIMAGSRFVVAGAVLTIWARLRGAPRPTRFHWGAAAIVGALMPLGGNGSVTWAEQYVPSGMAALMVGTVPLWVAVLDWVRPGGSRPGARVIAGLVLGFAGIVLLVGPSELASGKGMNPLGVGALLLAALLWSIGSLYSRHARLPDSPMLGTGMEMLTGGALLVVLGLATGEGSRLALGAVSPRSALSLAYLTIFGSLVAFSAYIWLIKATGPARASTYAFVNPVVAVFLGWALANEPLSARTLLAATIVVTAVVLITTSQIKEAQARARAEPAVSAAGAGDSGR